MMAESSTKHRFQDEQYVNWIKLGYALIVVADGLRPFCERVVRESHDLLRKQIGDKACTICTTKGIEKRTSGGAKCTVKESNEGTAEGTADDHEEHDTGTKARWYIDCRDGICNKWLDGIIAELCGEPCSWKNTNVKMWPTHHWQLAKIFMGPGQQPLSSESAKTDALGLLQLIKHCKLFRDRVDRQAAAKVIFCFYYTYVQQFITLQQIEATSIYELRYAHIVHGKKQFDTSKINNLFNLNNPAYATKKTQL